MKATHKHTRSSSDLRPSRKFMSMVGKARDKERTSLNVSVDSERIVLQNLVNNHEELSYRMKRGELAEDRANLSFDIGHLVRRYCQNGSLELPQSRAGSPVKCDAGSTVTSSGLNLPNQTQDKIKRLATQRKPGLAKLDDMIGRAIEDLDSDKRRRRTSPLRKSTKLAPGKIPKKAAKR